MLQVRVLLDAGLVLMDLRWGRLPEVDGGGLAVFSRKFGSKSGGIVRVNVRVLRSAGDGDVGKSAIDESAWAIGVYVGDDAPCRQPLGTVGGDRVRARRWRVRGRLFRAW